MLSEKCLSIRPWLPTLLAIGAALVVEPMRPLFFWVFGDYGFDVFLAVRSALLLGSLLLMPRSLFEWSPQTVPISKPGADALLSLRAFACFIVLLGHGTTVVFPPADVSSVIKNWEPFRLIMACPWIGVWIFFVLSGYLIGKAFYSGRYALGRLGIQRFYLNRVIRIAPIYWAAIVSIAYFETSSVFIRNNILGFLSSLAFFQQTEMPWAFIGALWSVQTEMGFYLAAPFIFVAIAWLIKHRQLTAPWLLAAFIVAGIIERAALLQVGGYYRQNIWIVSIFTPTISNIDLFAAGMLTNWLVPRYIAKPLDVRYVLAICLFLFFGGALVFSEAMTDHLMKTLIIFGPSVCAVLVPAAIIKLEVFAPDGRIVRTTQWFGVLTYAVYVVHEPIYMWIRRSASLNLSETQSLAFSLLAISAALLFGAICYFVIERPFDRLRARKLRPPSPA